MPFLPLVLLSPPDVGAIMDRMRAQLSKNLEVQYSVTRKDVPGKGTGRLVIERPQKMRFFAKWAADDFECAWNQDQTIEMSRVMKMYYEAGPYDRLYQPASSFTTLPDVTFPLLILAADPRLLYAVKPTLVGQETVAGAACDHLRGDGWDVWVAGDGRLLKWRYDRQTPGGMVAVQYEFSNYKFGVRYPDSFYSPPIPPGFKPYGLPRDPLPLQPGMAFPKHDWVTPSGSPASFESGKPFLVVVTDRDCEPSARASKALAALRKDIPVWLLSQDGRVPAALGGTNSAYLVAKDRGGRTLQRLFAPGTPLFFLVDKDHRIKRLWYGFEPDREDQFIREVRAEIGK